MHDPIKVTLPEFLLASQLDPVLREAFAGDTFVALTKEPPIEIDWSHVLFFEDSALLSLLLLERSLISLQFRFCHKGFTGSSFVGRQHVIRQLGSLGFLDLLVSSHLTPLTAERGEDISDLVNLDPDGWLGPLTSQSRVMRILYCRKDSGYGRGPKERDKADFFESEWIREQFVVAVEESETSWDLVKDGTFRSLILDQTICNIEEHAKESLGLATARIIRREDIESDWGLSSKDQARLSAQSSPLVQMLYQTPSPDAVLQVVTVDDGPGVPGTLGTVFNGLEKTVTGEYKDKIFEERFGAPTRAWTNPDARLCAFAFDPLGTSKPYRFDDEFKGLTAMRRHCVEKCRGSISLRSEQGMILHSPDTPSFGRPTDNPYRWCPSGGVLVEILVPLHRTNAPSQGRKRRWHPIGSTPRSDIVVQSVGELWNRALGKSQLMETQFNDCAEAIRALLRESQNLMLLTIFDWSLIPHEKDLFRGVLLALAKQLSRQGEPPAAIVFSNIPMHLLRFARGAVNRLSHVTPHICVFYTPSDKERIDNWLWFGIRPTTGQLPSVSAEDLKSLNIRGIRKCTGGVEAPTEAFLRHVYDKVFSSISFTDPLRSFRSLSANDFVTLTELLRQCPLFVEQPPSCGTTEHTGRFRARFSPSSINAALLQDFRGRFKAIINAPPVRHVRSEGIRLTSGKVVKTYYECGRLVETDIFEQLVDTLVHIALSFNEKTDTTNIDYVVSCTSPTLLFVTRIADGLRRLGINCLHHVFRQKSTIGSESRRLNIKRGASVLVFTDVISTGRLVDEMISHLREDCGATLVGVIALLDLRTPEEHQAAERARTHEQSGKTVHPTIVALSWEQVNKEDSGKYTWYVDHETCVLKPIRRIDVWRHFAEDSFKGIGVLAEEHASFSNLPVLIKRLKRANALVAGHFAHGPHHSEFVCDVRRLFADPAIRDAILCKLAAYVAAERIGLVVYPSHSNIYLLADDLAYRLGNLSGAHGKSPASLPVTRFVAAYWFKNEFGQSDYHLPISFEYEAVPETQGVLILDDGLCTGDTLKALIREIVSLYAEAKMALPALHVLMVVNRLSESGSAFWSNLALQAGGKLRFSSFFSIPVPAYPLGACPLCLEHRLAAEASRNDRRTYYERLFFRRWAEVTEAVDVDAERPGVEDALWLSSDEAHDFGTCLLALSRGHVQFVWEYLQKTRQSEVFRVMLIKRLLFRALDVQMEAVDPGTIVDHICDEMERPALTGEGTILLLQAMVNYAMASATAHMVLIPRMKRILDACRLHYDSDNAAEISGGLACLIDETLGTYSHEVQDRPAAARSQLASHIETSVNNCENGETCTQLAWLWDHVVETEHPIQSVGHAVQSLVRHNKIMQALHFSPRTAVEEAIGALGTLAEATTTSDRDLARAVNLARLAFNNFEEMYRCADIVGRQGFSARDVLDELLAYKPAMEQLDIALNALSKSGEDRDAVPSCYELAGQAQLELALLRLCWFEGRTRIVDLIKQFLSKPSQIALDVCNSWKSSKLPDETVLTVDDTLLSKSLSISAVCPDHIVTNAFNHWWANIVRKRLPEIGQISLAWQVEEIGDTIKYSLANTGTEKLTIVPRLRGLRGYQDRIREFGGDLNVGPSGNDYSCLAWLSVMKW